jgi:glyoxylase-like metal-dependent hydrolase (beta-lactamase superfamily II)
VAIHDAERRWLEDIDTQFAERPVPGFHDLVGGSVPVDRTLSDGDHLELGDGLTLEVIHTPGHSSGSISLFLREAGVLITGDAVPLVGEMPVYEDATASMRSVDKLMGIDGVKVLLGSWDAPRYGNEVRRALSYALGYLEEIDRKVKEIAERDQGISSLDLCRKVLDEMGMHQVPTLPLVARSFQSNLMS